MRFPKNRPQVEPYAYDIDASPRQPLPILYPFPSPIPTNRPAASTWEDEINLIAGVQAYFQLAHKVCTHIVFLIWADHVLSQRFIDFVPLTIEHELSQCFAKSIHQTILNIFVTSVQSGEVDLQDLVKEDPVIERRRKELEDRKSRLLQIKEKIDSFLSGGK